MLKFPAEGLGKTDRLDAILSASELDTIIIAYKIDNNKHNNDTKKINLINSNSEEVYCWVSKQKHKYNARLDVHPKCDIDNNSHYLYWNWQKMVVTKLYKK